METYCPHCKQVIWEEVAKVSASAILGQMANLGGRIRTCPSCDKQFADDKAFERHLELNACQPNYVVINKISSPTNHCTAEQHWAYSEKMMRLAYVEAFKHGYKHGREDAKAKELPKEGANNENTTVVDV